MKYAAASKSTGRVLDMRDDPYSDEDLKALREAYGEDIDVHQDFDASLLQSKGCPVVKIESGAIVEDMEASAEVEHENAIAIIVELYKTRTAMQAAIVGGFALEDELSAVDARIKEMGGVVAEIVARKVADVTFFTRMLTYLGLK